MSWKRMRDRSKALAASAISTAASMLSRTKTRRKSCQSDVCVNIASF